jgi:hypothetical protein
MTLAQKKMNKSKLRYKLIKPSLADNPRIISAVYPGTVDL